MISDPIFWLLAVTGVVITGISKSGFAGGAGVVAVPLLSFKIGVLEATAITLPLLLVMDAKTVRYYWSNIQWPELKALIPGAILGIILGGLFMGLISDRALLLILGVTSILFASWSKLQIVLAQFKGARAFWSMTAGLSSVLVHAGGPPINIYFISRNLPKLEWLATAGAFFAAMNIIKLIPYSLNEQWSISSMWLSLALLPAAYGGVWLGKRIQTKFSEQGFMLFCKALLFATGSALIFKSLW